MIRETEHILGSKTPSVGAMDILEFTCTGIENGGKFPIEHTGRGRDVSPEFIFSNLSPQAKTLAIALEDLSHPIKDFTHWLIWNIPAAGRVGSLPEGAYLDRAAPVKALGTAFTGTRGRDRQRGKRIYTGSPCTRWTARSERARIL